jgi:homoserine dehydrogenase
VLAAVTRILADLDISIDAMLQREPAEGEELVDVIILTHATLEKHVDAAIRQMEALSTVAGKIVRIRQEELPGA